MKEWIEDLTRAIRHWYDLPTSDIYTAIDGRTGRYHVACQLPTFAGGTKELFTGHPMDDSDPLADVTHHFDQLERQGTHFRV